MNIKMNYFRKITALCALTVALCLTLSGCDSGLKQTEADDSEEAMLNFLTNLQNGEFEMAKTYLLEGNPLLYVFPASEGEEEPELSAVYRQFCEKMQGLTFRIGEGESRHYETVFIAAKQYDFAAAINDAMLEALKTQCRSGGDAFSNYAGWMAQGIANAEMGEEKTVDCMASKSRDHYEIDHRSYNDQEYMNLITGGFFDYADFYMAVFTGSLDDGDQTCYIAAQGDKVIAYLEELSTPDTDGEMDDGTIAELNAFYDEMMEQIPGIYMGVYKDGDRVVSCVGIDFETANQDALINIGMVSGKYQGMTGEYLSLTSTIRSFVNDGMTYELTPTYGTEK